MGGIWSREQKSQRSQQSRTKHELGAGEEGEVKRPSFDSSMQDGPATI